MSTKPKKLLDKIKGRLEPILTNEDLGFEKNVLHLNVYHPSVLPKESSLAIYDIQATMDWLNDRLIEKSKELEELREVDKPDEENLKKRKELSRDLDKLNDETDSQFCEYISILAKIKSSEFRKKIDNLYTLSASDDIIGYEELLDYPKSKLISDIFQEINLALAEQRKKELGIDIKEDTPTIEKK
jgi:hypothetical protein